MNQVAEDEVNLRKLLVRLNQAIDRGQQGPIAACYAIDSLEEHGPFRGTGQEFAAWVTRAEVRNHPWSTSYHLLGQSLFTIDGSRATGETYYTYISARGETAPEISFARYLDCFTNESGQWLVKHRRLVLEWYGSLGGQAFSADGYARSAPDRTDQLFAAHDC